MKKITIALFLIALTACGRTPEQARQELGKLGVDYNEWSCFESTRKQDKLAIELFLDAEMNSECVLAGAALTGNIELVKKTLSRGADPNLKWANLDAAYADAWFGSQTGGNLGAGTAFLEEDLSSIYPLSIAAQKGHAEIVKLLLEKGASPNGSEQNDSPLDWAASNGHTEAVSNLLDAGAKPNNSSGQSIALNESISKGHFETAKLLLEQRANPDDSTIYYATRQGNPEIVKLLIKKGANPNLGLFEAAKKGRLEIVNLLLENGANPNFREKDDYSYQELPLYAAVSNNHLEVAKAFLNKNVDPNTTSTRYRNSILEEAAEKGNVEMVKTIVEKGAKINSESSYGELESQSLIAAIEEGHIEVVKILLDKEANPNTEGSYNRSALEIAVQSGNTEIVRELLSHKADVNEEKGIYGGTLYSPALEAARENENSEIISLLKNAGAVE